MLYTLDRLEDVERIEGLLRRDREIQRAYLTNYAFADGDALSREASRNLAALRGSAGAAPAGAFTADDRAIIAQAMAAWNTGNHPPREVS